MSNPDGLSKALMLAAEGSSCLEYTHAPTLADKKKAMALFKRASDILKQVIGLEIEGCYETGPRPPDPNEAKFADPAEHKIEMPEVPPPTELPALPQELQDFDNWDEDEATDVFSDRTKALLDRVDPQALLSEEALSPWDDLWERSPKEAFTRLLVAEARETPSIEIPTDEERDAWLARFAPIAAEPEQTPPSDDLDVFAAMLDQLKERGVASGQKPKAWKKAYKAWMIAYQEDTHHAFSQLQGLLERGGCTWEIPGGEA